MIKELNNIFFDILQWHQKRIEFLVLFIEALIKVRTVNLSELAEAFNTSLDKESNYRRIQRFFLEYNFWFIRYTITPENTVRKPNADSIGLNINPYISNHDPSARYIIGITGYPHVL